MLRDAQTLLDGCSPSREGSSRSFALRGFFVIGAAINCVIGDGMSAVDTKIHLCCNGLTDPLRLCLDLPVSEVSVAERHAGVGVTEHAGDDRQRDALEDGVACYGVCVCRRS